MTIKHIFEFHGLHQLSHHWRLPAPLAARLLLCLQAFAGFVLFSCISDGFTYVFKKAGIFLPGSVAALIALVLVLFLSPTAAIENFLKPGSSLLLKWLSMFYVPALVGLPISLQLVPSSDYIKLVAIQISGVVFVAVFSGWCLTAMIHIGERLRIARYHVIMEREIHHESLPAHPASQNLLLSSRVVIWTSFVVTALIGVYGAIPGNDLIFFVLNIVALPCIFVIGQYPFVHLPKWPIPHPIVAATAVSIGLISILASVGNQNFYTLLKEYNTPAVINIFSGISGKVGPGNIFLYILNAAIVAMALPINSRKSTFLLHGIELLSASAVISFVAIIVTIVVARLLNTSPAVIRSIPLRTATTPIAIATVAFIGGNSGIAGVMSVTFGIIGGILWRPLFRINRFNTPMIRGFTVGCMAHGLGTAIITAAEPEAGPFSSLSFVVVAVMSSVWIAIPAIRNVIVSMIE